MTLKELLEKKASHIKAATDLRDKAAGESRDLSDVELQAIDKHLSDADGVDAEVKAAEERAVRADAMNARLNTASAQIGQSAGRKTAPDGVAVTAGVKERAVDDPKKGFKSHREFLSAVIANGDRHPQSAKDGRLKILAAVGSDEQGTYDNSRGGFLVPEGFSPNLLQLAPEDDPTTGTMAIPMQTPTVKIPARTDKDHSTSVCGGLTVSRRAETVAAGTSRMQIEEVVLNAYSLFGGAYVTEELLQDSPQSFAAILAAGFSDQFNFHMIGERLVGTGIGEHQGVLNAPATISIAKETGQAAATINYQNILKMSARCWRYGSARWIANHTTKPQLAQLVLAIGTGGVPIYQPGNGAPDMLLGRPIMYTEHAKALGTVGDIILGNWSEYLEGLYQPLQSAESIHVRFLNHERTMKFWLRNAGAPWWRTALTPKNGDTLSPFITLATRA